MYKTNMFKLYDLYKWKIMENGQICSGSFITSKECNKSVTAKKNHCSCDNLTCITMVNLLPLINSM